MNKASYPIFVKRDLDGFFGLFIDNLVQLLLIAALCTLCGIGPDSELLLGYILPGAGISILLGNLFYAVQAHRLARRTGRSDITALPYGINTPSLLVYIFFVMLPAYHRTEDPQYAWRMGLIACLGSGVIELLGSLVAEQIRRRTPRAALLSTLAGIAIGFISMTFALQVLQRPIVAMLPLAIILVTYFSGVQLPWGLPGGFIAVLVGTACAWLLEPNLPAGIRGPGMSLSEIAAAWELRGLHLPHWVGGTILQTLTQNDEWMGYLSVIVPMGLFNVIGSLQNIESAEAAGDPFRASTSLAANGLGTIAASLFGSCFPTTIYIGHPGWKSLGARAGYSTLNGLVVTLICISGTVGVIGRVIPLEAGIAIVLWIGIIITAQAFQAVPQRHAPAVAVGLFPAIAAWGMTVMQGSFIAAGGTTLQEILTQSRDAAVNGFLVNGMILMERGYIFTCMLLAAITVFLIERQFRTAAIWSFIAAAFAWLGLTHAFQVSGNNVDFLFRFSVPDAGALSTRGDGIAIGYVLFAVTFAGIAMANLPPDETASHAPSAPDNQSDTDQIGTSASPRVDRSAETPSS